MVIRVAPREDAGTDGTRLSVLSDWLGARSLALVPPGEIVLIAEVGVAETERRYAEQGLRRGMVAQCVGNDGGRVTLNLGSGLKVELAPEDAWFVWVTAPPREAPVSRIAASPSTRR